MNLSPTAKVILGMLRMRPRSGYEIKSFVDKSTSFFWSASYGSIYPELKRLRDAGLIEGTEDPTGDRRRVVHRLTEAGEQALEDWFEAENEPLTSRDEGLLKMFFSTDRAEAAASLRDKAEMHREIVARLREIEPLAAEIDSPNPFLTLKFGLDSHEFARRWCEREAERLEDPDNADRRDGRTHGGK